MILPPGPATRPGSGMAAPQIARPFPVQHAGPRHGPTKLPTGSSLYPAIDGSLDHPVQTAWLFGGEHNASPPLPLSPADNGELHSSLSSCSPCQPENCGPAATAAVASRRVV